MSGSALADTDGTVRLAGQYSLNVIQSYLNDIHAAAYPHTPSQVGGALYDALNASYENFLKRLETPEADPLEIAAEAVNLMRYAANYEGGSDYARAYFQEHQKTMDEILSGKPLPDIFTAISQKPDDPLSPAPI
jgi:hypothetical protein